MLIGNKRLIAFPVMAFTAEAVVLAAFVAPYVAMRHGFPAGPTHLGIAGYGLGVLCYLALTAVSAYVNAALLIAVGQGMQGGQPNVGGALRCASRVLPSILAWSVVSSTVGLLVRALDRRVPMVTAILGISWSALSFFALPVVVFEGVGPLRGTRRAAELLRSAWREEATGTLRLGGILLLLAIPAAPVLFFGFGSENVTAMLLAVAVCALWFGLCGLVLSCLTSVYRVAVYLYATTNVAPAQFTGVDLGRAFA
ncbi:DUF6159 family protein [Actinocrinis puniceicyclus]|uniref:DUF6159 family protein n=1 Tax=Actinocrinis puniceicyclus TaxID=977794 RepID=UPI001B8C75F6|nr:DUF6159 family protein [Actinocrinis puniceicyclus]